MNVSQMIVDFITCAIQSGGWMEMDRLYLQNRILGLIGEVALTETEVRPVTEKPITLMDQLVAKAKANQVIGETLAETEILEGQLMDFLTPPPSVVNAFFAQHYETSPATATDYFFELCQRNDYIKTRGIAKNIVFPIDTEYGALDITINLSKPEKDPKEIAAQKQVVAVDYPKCMLCMENEGYLGRSNYPARTNHRIIRMNLDGESWGFQYSPYAYYNEHCIFLSEEHRPMKIERSSFERLVKIVDVLPHYFAGSNADLPIVGGSILSHDHYQGGRYEFAMAKAPIETTFDMADFPQVSAGIVKWPMSVIRLQSADKKAIVDASERILASWQTYSVPELEIVAFSPDGTPHHTVTPIARRRGELFEIDLVLRDNNVSAEHPDGIFHPHQEVQHIKKENIGLIEVMGLAVLPPRLEKELVEVEKYLINEANEIADYHLPWAENMKAAHHVTAENVQAIVQQEVGLIFKQVLEHAGVFKRDEKGQAAFNAFVTQL